MRHEVTLCFGPGREIEIPVHADDAMPADVARRWLDEQFVANDCEPLRASGKVLTADKVLALAEAAGAAQFARDAAWADAFARAVLGSFGRPVVTVDVASRSVSH